MFFRFIFELIIFILVITVARALLSSFMKGISSSSSPSRSRNQEGPGPPSGSELHKDPVCGTYVAESTAYSRHAGGQTFYYCSENCREKHTLVAH